MFTVEKAEKLLDITKREYPSLNDELIFIENGNQFSMMEFIGICTIEIQDKIKEDQHTKWMYKYLKNQYNLDANIYMFYDFIETFVFLHEVGHLYYKDITNVEMEYKEYKEKIYNTYEEAWKIYREMPHEKLADEFSANMIKNNLFEIWSIMNDISIEKAQEEHDFWSIME